MQNLNLNPAITKILFDRVTNSVAKFCDDTSMHGRIDVLTEGDMQAWIFHYLQLDLSEAGGGAAESGCNKIGIHCNPYFLTYRQIEEGIDEGKSILNKSPDIVILDKEEYSLCPSGSLFKRKGFTAWGSAIMLELKLLRPMYSISHQAEHWKEDIDKLDLLKRTHYPPGSPEKFFSLFVLLCRQNLPQDDAVEIQTYAASKGVIIMISCPGLTTQITAQSTLL
jgi:hypothetical protein